MHNFFVLAALLLAGYASVEALKRSTRFDVIETRKIAHVLSALATLLLYASVDRQTLILLSLFFIVFFLISARFSFLTSIHVKRYFTIGEIVYPAGILFLVLFFHDVPRIFVSSVLILGISDTVSGLYHFYVQQKKSFVGSALFFGCTLALLCMTYAFFLKTFTVPLLLKLSVVSFILAIVEAESPYGLDNLSVPVVASLALLLV